VRETKTLETPTDAQIKEEMARVRVAQANHERDERLKPPEKKEYGEVFTFRLRQFQTTQFRGLWELSILDAKGNVREIVTDADALTNVLETIGLVLENRGF
jgi:hypothetical protein